MKDVIVNELRRKLTPDLIPQPYNEWARILGASNLYDFVLQYGGATLYIPKPEVIIRNVRNNLIKQEFNGFNCKELAIKYGLSETWIRSICNDKEEKSIC